MPSSFARAPESVVALVRNPWTACSGIRERKPFLIEAALANFTQLWHTLPQKTKEAKMSQERLTMRKIGVGAIQGRWRVNLER
jgi:hypothetical protein